jgi:hypothetical protein
MPGNRTPLRVHVLRSLERKMNAPFTVPTRRSVSEPFLGLFFGAFFWTMKTRFTTNAPAELDLPRFDRYRGRYLILEPDGWPDARDAWMRFLLDTNICIYALKQNQLC